MVTKERSLSESYPAVAGSVPRARNAHADALVNSALDGSPANAG